MWVPAEARRGQSPGAKVPGSCESPGVDAGNQLRFSREQRAFLAAEAAL